VRRPRAASCLPARAASIVAFKCEKIGLRRNVADEIADVADLPHGRDKLLDRPDDRLRFIGGLASDTG